MAQFHKVENCSMRDNAFFFIEGPILENHGLWHSGWHDHVFLTKKNLHDLMELKYASHFGF